MAEGTTLETKLRELFAKTNSYDIPSALEMFELDAVIEDPSVGEQFDGRNGVKDYLNRFFVAYHTTTKVISIVTSGANALRARVDFTGDFGHEVGLLIVSFSERGSITRIEADLE